MESIYELYGYLNLFPGLSGFLYPVFRKDGQSYLADGNIRYIRSFHLLKLEYINNVTHLSSFNTTSCFDILYQLGSPYPHIYQKESGEIYIGSGNYLYKQLLDYQLSNPILQQELNDFLQEIAILCSQKKFSYGTGRRKKAVARVFLSEGTGKITINHKHINDYFLNQQQYQTVQRPFILTNTAYLLDAYITVQGGGISGQAGAVQHGISRALLDFDSNHRTLLKSENLLTRDPRMKERKKPGLKGARRSSQHSKR